MVEEAGFEPAIPISQYDSFRDCSIQPLWHSSFIFQYYIENCPILLKISFIAFDLSLLISFPMSKTLFLSD